MNLAQFAALMFLVPAISQASISQAAISQASNCNNGLYLSTSWLNKPRSDAEIVALAKRLRESNIRNVFINATDVNAVNPLATNFLKTLGARLPDAKVIGMIYRSPCGVGTQSKDKCFNPSDEQDRHRLNRDASNLWSAGFHGVQIDYEPAVSGDGTFLEILEHLRKTKPSGKMLSVAGSFLALEGKEKDEIKPSVKSGQSLLIWNRDYYAAVMSKVDQVMLMNYDTALRSEQDYIRFTDWQVRQLTRLASDAKIELQVGLPSNMKGRAGLYDRAAENLGAGIKGVQSALGSASCPEKVGVSIFNDASMNSELWKSFNDAFPTSHSRAPKQVQPTAR